MQLNTTQFPQTNPTQKLQVLEKLWNLIYAFILLFNTRLSDRAVDWRTKLQAKSHVFDSR
jgi:hypothetical protein